MDEQKGWVSLSRKLLDNPIWRKKPYSEGQALVELILLANHEDKKAYYQGHIAEFKRGTITTSMLSLADRWGWDRKKLRKFLKVLEVNETITITTTTHGTTITLVNYDFYQRKGTTKGTTKRATTPQPLLQSLPTNNNDNNENNENKNIVRHWYGEYSNVLLSNDELEKLKSDYPAIWKEKLEALSEYMKSTGRSYKDHYATIRNWIRRDQKEKGVRHDGSSNTGERGKVFELEDYL